MEESMTKTKSGVYFVDGLIGRPKIVGIVAYLKQYEDDDVEFTRFYTYNHDTGMWRHTNWNHDIASVSYTRIGPERTWHLLSKRGILVQYSADGSRELIIPDADTGPGKLGYVTQIQLIADQLYVCGFRRQVYRLDGDIWTHLDEGILAPVEDLTHGFQSIDGNAPDDLYAVGLQGEMFHYDGRSWQQIDLPTNRDLNRVRCVRPDLVYACGDSGVLIRGSGNTWDLIQNSDVTPHFYGVEVFNETVYLSSLSGLWFLNGDVIASVPTELDPAPKGYRLHTRDGMLWSFGQDDLVFFDGTKWERIICPDNAVP